MNDRGQALIETALFFLEFSGLLVCLLAMTQWFTTRQKILMATREAALLYSSGHFQRDEVRDMVFHYLTTGSPVLDRGRISVKMGPSKGFQAKLFSLDVITIKYVLPSNWLKAIGLNPNLEETCIIKHASHYGPPFQTLWGPPFPW
jgi:hypothetical protein